MRKMLRSALSADMSTKKQFRIVMTFNTILLLLAILISSAIYTYIVLNRNEQYINRIVSQYHASILSQSGEFRKFVKTVACDTTCIQYMTEKDLYRRHELSRQVNTLFSNMKIIQPKALELFVFLQDDPAVTFSSIAQSQENIVKQLRMIPDAEILDVYPCVTSQGTVSALIVGSSVYDISEADISSVPIGAVAAAFSLHEMESSLSGLADLDGVTYGVFSNTRQQLAGDITISDKPLYQRALSLANRAEQGRVSSLYQSIIVIPTKEINGYLLVLIDRIVMLKDLLIVTILVILISVVMVFFINRLFHSIRMQITVPLERLTLILESIGNNKQLERRVPEIGNKDIRILTRQLNQLFETESKLTKNLLEVNSHLYEAELTKNRIELQFLRSQINPHFLYNTLETIRSIAIVRNVPEVAATAKSLAMIMRYSIKGQDIVPMREEIAIIKCYLSIQQLRFRDRFDVQFCIDARASEQPVPRMCLQPLVENAIVHGLESLMRKGLLIIRCWVEMGKLAISIIDNGNGITEDKLQEINEQIKQPMRSIQGDAGSIGILNIARRLNIMLHGNFDMCVESLKDQGTSVTLRLPLSGIGESWEDGGE